MADYFLVHPRQPFESQIRPTLVSAWLGRSFEPCRALCEALVCAAETFAQRYHTGTGEALVSRVAAGLSFDRDFWRILVGEILLIAAIDIPQLQTCPETLCCLLGEQRYVGGAAESLPRESLPLILQAHRGSRDLAFGPAIYRPEAAGYHNGSDVQRMADYLAAVRPEVWQVSDLRALSELADEADQAEELALAQEWFGALQQLYTSARDQDRVVICERIP